MDFIHYSNKMCLDRLRDQARQVPTRILHLIFWSYFLSDDFSISEKVFPFGKIICRLTITACSGY